MFHAIFRRRSRIARSRTRFYRPLVESLESRELLAFNLTISPAATAGVSIATAAGTTTFLATGAGANVSVADINSALSAGNNVTIDSGVAGFQTGNISTSNLTSISLQNVAGTTLRIQSGTGLSSVRAEITLVGVQLENTGTLILDANDNVTLSGIFSATNITIEAGLGNIAMAAAGDAGSELAATTLSLLAGGDIGTAAISVRTNATELTTNTAAGNGDQFIREENGLTALNLNAGSGGNITLNAASGAVSDSDADTDVLGATATITLGDFAKRDFGGAANPIHTNVDDLSVVTPGTGNQFITEANGLTSVDLSTLDNQGATPLTAAIVLTLTAGGLSDQDIDDDLRSSNATIVLNAGTPRDIGSAANPMQIRLLTLAANTAVGGGSQFFTEINSLQGINLNAGTGNVALTLNSGGLSDLDVDPDIVAATATVSLLDTTPRNFGTAGNRITTGVGDISVNTAAGGGSQFFVQGNSTIVTSLDAGTGNINLLGGTFDLADDNALGDLSTLTINSAVIKLASADEAVGGLAGNGTVEFRTDAANHTLIVGANNSDTSFSGLLTGNDVAGGISQDRIRKVGTGTLTLSGNSPFMGEYEVLAGKLLVNASIPTSLAPFIVSNATAGGTGSINRLVVLRAGGRLAPGNSTGILSTDNLQFQAGSSFDVEITSDTGGQFDQVEVSENVSIQATDNGVELNIAKSGTVNLLDGDQLTIIDNDGSNPVAGTFKNLPEGANLGSNFLGTGLTAIISYKGFNGNGNDVVLTMSPGSLFPWHNPDEALDAVGSGANPPPDGIIAPGDAAAIINYINGFGSGAIPANAVIGEPFGFLDTAGGENGGGDNAVAPNDALAVINAINAGQGGEGEPTTDAQPPLSSAQSVLNELIELLAIDVASQSKRRR